MIDKIKNYVISGGTSFIFLILAFNLCLSIANGQGLPHSELSKLQAEDNPGWKVVWDKQTSVAKRLFNAKSKVFPGKPQDAAREFLAMYHGLFGLPPDLRNLQIRERIKTPLGERVIFRQYHNQIPVVGAEVDMHISRKNSIFCVENHCIPNITIDTQPSVEKDYAVSTAERALGVDATKVEKVSSELVILPSGPDQHLAWRVIVSKKGLIDRTWLVYVDAKKKGWVLYKKKLQSSAAGTGSVYTENPITTPDFTTVTLNNLTDNTSLLEGDYGKPYNANCLETAEDTSDLSGLFTVSSSNRDYSYANINDNRLEEVMAYYHLNRVHDTLKSSYGFSSLDNQIPMFVNAQDPDSPSKGYDNAFYSRDDNFSSTGYLLFGCGDELNNLGLDSDVITHEYGHAVLDHIQPELYEVIEHNYSGAIHESVGDTMASYFGTNGIIGEWGLTARYGSGNYTRDMDNTRKYPDDVYEPSYGVSEVHYTGEILNGVYWDIKDAVGTDTAFQLFFSAINLLPNDANFFDMRDAWVTADSSVNDGANTDAIETAFANHGIEGDDPGNNATWKLNKLIFYKYDPDTGIVKKQKTFQRGDDILIYVKANIPNVTPAYNLIAKDITLTVSGEDVSGEFDGYLNYEEAVKGLHEYQVAYLTSDSVSGKVKVKVKVRMGGSNTVKVKTGTFTIK
ncbi:MAG TPA: M36 family metallopeptidase [Candidatus Wunengus sp. YC60]|uniref:M36 family metallopeptidase n=1 Tax=Candidatus Wunengus sp. YC60 TaxID=3367697 RepID=UPI0040258EC2